MNPNYKLIKGEFQHMVLKGSAYEVGRTQGEILKNNREMRTRIEKTMLSFANQSGFASLKELFALKRAGLRNFEELQAFFEMNSPGLSDEIQGFADGLGTEIDQLPFFWATYAVPKNCSQFAVLSSATKDNHTYVGRSYEWTHLEEDLRLCTTRIRGKAKHIGFSIFLFGRADGLNHHGVSVTFTGGGIFGVPLKHEGFQSHLIIRTLLDNCTSVDDAMDFVRNTRISGHFNLLIADSNDNAVLMEFADGTCDFKRIHSDSVQKYIFSTNHYTLPATVQSNEHNCGIIQNSRKRSQLLDSTLKDAVPRVTKETLRTILSRGFPHGVCDHYYSQGFGTVWSLIFDLTTRTADICFGAPTHNKWRSFTLSEPVGVHNYPALFPDAGNAWPY